MDKPLRDKPLSQMSDIEVADEVAALAKALAEKVEQQAPVLATRAELLTLLANTLARRVRNIYTHDDNAGR